MKKLFLIRFSVVAFFCLLCVLPALAANIKIKGAVKDKLSKEPLIGATIRLLGTQAGAVTDMEGNFELNSMGVLEGMYDIEIKYVGYKTEVRRKVRVENGKLVILNLATTGKVGDDGETWPAVQVHKGFGKVKDITFL